MRQIKEALLRYLTLKSIILMSIIMMTACMPNNEEPKQSQNKSQKTMTGAVIKGPVSGATIEIFALNEKGEKIGDAINETSTITDENGNWDLPEISSVNALLIEAKGGMFVDESDPETDIDKKRRVTLSDAQSLFGIIPAGESKGVVTFLTHALYLQTKDYVVNGGSFHEAFKRTRTRVTNVLEFDPFITTPANPTNPDISATPQQIQYALVVGGQANMMNSMALKIGKAQMDYDVFQIFRVDFDNCVLGDEEIRIPTTDGGYVSVVTDLTLPQQMQRFRNNNYSKYKNSEIPSFNEADLCDREMDTLIEEESFILSVNDSLADSYLQTTDMKGYADLYNEGNTSVINFMNGFDIATGEYNTGLDIRFKGRTVDEYQITNNDLDVSYRINGINFTSDVFESTGVLNITSFNDVSQNIEGRYRFSLCRENTECNLAEERIVLSGFFSVKREIDYKNTSEGESETVKPIMNNSYIGVVSQLSDSYYKIEVSESQAIEISLTNISDNVDLSVYNEDDFTTPVCTSIKIDITDEKCIAEFSGGIAYIRVSHEGSNHDADFTLHVKRENFSVSIDSGSNETNYYENSSSIKSRAVYDNTQPLLKSRINLTSIDNPDPTSNVKLNFKLSDFDIGTYDIFPDIASAKVKYGLNNYEVISGNIRITDSSGAGGRVSGTYELTLCNNGRKDCLLEKQFDLQGHFNLVREADINIVSQGSPDSPHKYNPATNFGDNYTATVEGSVYQFEVPSFTQQILELSYISADVTIDISDNKNFTNSVSQILDCTSNASKTSQVCAFDVNGNSLIYVRVATEDLNGSSYDMNMSENKYSLSVDGGKTIERFEKETNSNDSYDDVRIFTFQHITSYLTFESNSVFGVDYQTSLSINLPSYVTDNPVQNFIIGSSGISLLHEGAIYESGTFTTGEVNINTYGTVGNDYVLIGDYHFNLCPQNSCSSEDNYLDIEGRFSFIED